jgi:hypothetical protein
MQCIEHRRWNFSLGVVENGISPRLQRAYIFCIKPCEGHSFGLISSWAVDCLDYSLRLLF